MPNWWDEAPVAKSAEKTLKSAPPKPARSAASRNDEWWSDAPIVAGKDIVEDVLGPFKRAGNRIVKGYQDFAAAPSLGAYGKLLKETGTGQLQMLLTAPAEAVNNVVAPRITEPFGRALYDAGIFTPSKGVEISGTGSKAKYRIGDGPWQPVPTRKSRAGVTQIDYDALEREFEANPQSRDQAGRTFDQGVGIAGNAALMAAGAGGPKVRPVQPGNALERVANRLSGGRVISPEKTARAVVGKALANDGGSPTAVRNVLSEWSGTKASAPSVLDVSSQLSGGGQNVKSLARGTALKNNQARSVLSDYADDVSSNVGTEALRHTDALHPERRTTPEFVGETRTDLQDRARPLYDDLFDAAPPQQHPSIKRAMATDPIIQDAVKAAERQMKSLDNRPSFVEVTDVDVPQSRLYGADDEAASGLNALSETGGVYPGTVADRSVENVPTLELLDRAKRYIDDLEQQAIKYGNTSELAPIEAARRKLVTALDEINPDYARVRAVGGEAARMEEAANAGAKVMTAKPGQYRQSFEDIKSHSLPVQDIRLDEVYGLNQGAFPIAAKNAVIDALNTNQPGVITRLTRNRNYLQNLETAFGQEKTGQYLKGLSKEAQRLLNARAVDIRAGSQTAPMLADAENTAAAMVEGAQTLIDVKTGGWWRAVRSGLDALKGGRKPNDAEARAIAELITSVADEGLIQSLTTTRTRNASALAAPVGVSSASMNYLNQGD